MKSNDPTSRTAITSIALYFVAALAVMEVTAVFAANQSGRWPVLIFAQPACLMTALVVGAWLGLLTSCEDEVPKRELATANLRPVSDPIHLAAPAGALAVRLKESGWRDSWHRTQIKAQ